MRPTNEHRPARQAHDHSHAHGGGHNHGHGEGHDHSHDHPPAPSMQGKLALAVTLNLVFVGVELAYDIIPNSVALIADAGHNLSDVLGLAATLVAAILATRPASGRFTYG